MSKTASHIVETAYRATLEEQDDPVVWLCHACAAPAPSSTCCSTGNAVAYGVRAQEVAPLAVRQPAPAERARSRRRPRAVSSPSGSPASTWRRTPPSAAIDAGELLEGLVPVSRAKLALLFAGYDQVHRW